jgi:hypothetical protein
MKNDDKFIGPVLFGILLVVVLKVTELIMSYFFKDFTITHRYITNGISGFIGAFVAFSIVNRFFTNPFGKSNK